jgi:hypothetical protein
MAGGDMSRRIFVVALWVVSLLATAQYAKAQRSPDPTMLQAPIVVSGNDIGFRVQGYGPDSARGQLVVRVNGIWQTAVVVPTASQGQ